MTIIQGCFAAFHRFATSGIVPSASPGTAAELTLPFSSFVAPISVFSLQSNIKYQRSHRFVACPEATHLKLDKCPLYLSQAPAALISSVVHFPRIRIRQRRPSNSSGVVDANSSAVKCGSKGASSSRRVEVGEMASSVSGTGVGRGVGR